MLIGIDGNEANVGKRVGVGEYAYELLVQFYKIRNPKSEIRNNIEIQNTKFQIYLKQKPLSHMPKEREGWEYRIVGPSRLWTQIGLPLALYKDSRYRGRQINVFWTPTHYAPRFCPCPRVISIFDLSFIHYPQMFKKSDLYQLKNWTSYSVKKASKILTISKASKDDIIKIYRVPGEKVVVTYPGIKSEIRNPKFEINSKSKMQNSKILKEKYGIDGDYILFVGTLQPRKNIARLIEAFSKISNLQLVIVGKKGWLYEEILQAPKKFGVEDSVKFLDFVVDEDLPLLYQNALCFVLPSLYEGFGLPVLEAMSYGCPVITSNVSSLPEAGGDAALYVDPKNVDSISSAIKKVIEDKILRKTMVEKGYKQVKKFSWEKTAMETLKVLEEVGGKNIKYER